MATLTQMVESHLSHCQTQGWLTPLNRQRHSPQHYRRQRKITKAVEALINQLIDYSYDEEISTPCVTFLRNGTNYSLEEEAAQILANGRRGDLKLTDPKDWFTHEQLQLRLQREVYCTQGQPDASLTSGLYRRAYNPLAGQRPTRLSGGEDVWG